MPVPVWVIILAVLAGLLLLAVLVFVMYRVSNGLRKREGEKEKVKGEKEKRMKQTLREEREGPIMI
jgi:intercellular adhesion molecule 4